MSYTPQQQHALYRLAKPGELDEGRLADIRDQPGQSGEPGRIEFILHPDHAEEPLLDQFTRVTNHCVVHGLWRQRWTDDGRMARPAQGLRLCVLRWETVPADLMPSGRAVMPTEDHGWCIHLVSDRYCTSQLRDAMNDLLLRLGGDGLWVQVWFKRRPFPPVPAPDPLLAAPTLPMALV
ncbi:hypothetical protein PV413_23910 [Streptomyces scabiei]|uniref:hypothetical protein n=2 Tax=Streptomyces scabiei TaxID=1930 RepID=UPI0029A12892|nr:hypothetical protein [Streptomyces scabiei]MDX2566046.1 hypothetical protein [Streptomyces scabiei]MDX3150470.1 hypothetical protein [Streptomyces scabiei]MDX3150474.1 hypothetical protein [Streptomyces scabiei]MDX3288086.1 hypothetical protein [Streptomyces scabiei]